MNTYLDGFKDCLQHEISFCAAACPFNLDVNTFISRLQEGRFDAAYKVFRDATGFPFIAVSGSQRFIKRILCDFFRQGLIFDDCHHVRINLQVIGIVQFFIIQNRSPPFYTD